MANAWLPEKWLAAREMSIASVCGKSDFVVIRTIIY